jgi:hypothetical protein
LVVEEGVVNVPGEVKTVMFANPPAAAAADVHVEPLDVRTFPVEPGATKFAFNADVPLPKITEFAVIVAAPVPPLATGSVPVTLDVRLQYVVDVDPVPPLAIASVPATETAPDVAVDGVKPVEPKLIVVTPPAAGLAHAGTPPTTVKI